jgi:hypothetical protein
MQALSDRLKKEEEIWNNKSYQELVSLTYPVVYEREKRGEPGWYEVEITLLEKNDQYVHIGVAVSSGGLSSFLPKSTSVIVYATKKDSSV